MKTLTKTEEQVMQVLWKLQQGFLKDILENSPEPKPHSNTVATILNGAHIGRESIVGAGALVVEGTVIPPVKLYDGGRLNDARYSSPITSPRAPIASQGATRPSSPVCATWPSCRRPTWMLSWRPLRPRTSGGSAHGSPSNSPRSASVRHSMSPE